MSNSICFREVKKSDYRVLEKIISDTWGFENFCSPEVAEKMARLYLAGCLSEQTFTCVALNNSVPVGVIMGKDSSQGFSLRYGLMQLKGLVSMLLSREGRKVLALFNEFDKVQYNLLQECGQSFAGELTFFAVRSDQRGKGIGKELYKRLMHYFKKQQICSFYLYTDTTCNVGFYEYQGLKKESEKVYSLKPHRDQDITFFLYTKLLE